MSSGASSDMIAVSLRSSLIIDGSQLSGQHVMSEALQIISSRLFARLLQVTTLSHSMAACCFIHFVVFTTDFDKRHRHMCTTCARQPDQGRVWKNILVQVQKVTAPYREVTYSLKILWLISSFLALKQIFAPLILVISDFISNERLLVIISVF